MCVFPGLQGPGVFPPVGSCERLSGSGLQEQVQGSHRLLHGAQGTFTHAHAQTNKCDGKYYRLLLSCNLILHPGGVME